jgi:hypothetical protein
MTRFVTLLFVGACATGAAAQTPAGTYPAAPAGVAAPPLPVTTPPDQAPGAKPETPPVARRATALKLPPQTLQLNLSVFGGSGDDLNSFSGLPNGPHVDADAALAYDRRAGRLTFGARGRSVVRRSDTADSITPLGQQGSIDLLFASGRQTFHANQSVSYSPYYDFGGLRTPGDSSIGESAASHGDFANRDLSNVTTTSTVDWSHPISRRYGLLANYNLRRTTFSDSPEFDMTSQDVGLHLTRRFTRSVSMRYGYSYRTADATFGQTVAPRSHDIDLGVDYGRVLAKGTTFTFSTGSSVTPQDERLFFNVTGNAGLTRQFARTWTTHIGVNRNVQLLEGFAAPVIVNAVTANAAGALGRRFGLSSTVAYSRGSVGLDRDSSSPYSNVSGGVGLSFTLGRQASIEAQYFYAGYLYHGDLSLVPGLTTSEQRRQGVRIGFTWHGMLVGHLRGYQE